MLADGEQLAEPTSLLVGARRQIRPPQRIRPSLLTLSDRKRLRSSEFRGGPSDLSFAVLEVRQKVTWLSNMAYGLWCAEGGIQRYACSAVPLARGRRR
eukprot:4324129-Prymnesium_polylepis.1